MSEETTNQGCLTPFTPIINGAGSELNPTAAKIRETVDANASTIHAQTSFLPDDPKPTLPPKPVTAPRLPVGAFPSTYTSTAMGNWSDRVRAHLDSTNQRAALERCHLELTAIEDVHKKCTASRLAAAIIAGEMLERMRRCPLLLDDSAEEYVEQALAKTVTFLKSATARSRLPKAGIMWRECGYRGLLQPSAPDPFFPFITLKLAAKFDPLESWNQLCLKLGRTPVEKESRDFVAELFGLPSRPPKPPCVRVDAKELEEAVAQLETGRTDEALIALRSWLAKGKTT